MYGVPGDRFEHRFSSGVPESGRHVRSSISYRSDFVAKPENRHAGTSVPRLRRQKLEDRQFKASLS